VTAIASTMSRMYELKQNLKRLRRLAEMSQQALATQAGLSVSLVVQIERGSIRDPRISTVGRLARALNTSIDALAGHELDGIPEAAKHAKGPPRPRKGKAPGK
jgi:transcriptional regulator with XRE-family HTH domain